jgi:FG-GAP repeat
MMATGLLLCLIIGGGILAQWSKLRATSEPVLMAATSAPPGEAAAVPSPTPALLAKDYIYAGGRLVATEAQGSNSAQGNGLVTESPNDPSAQPPPIVYTDIAVFRPSDGTWYVHNTVDGSLTAQLWGMAGDKPVPGDYDGDGKLDFAVFRPSDSHWYILRSSDGGMDAPVWGLSTDEPVPGDYDGDGKWDVGVRRGSTWYIVKSSDPANYMAQQWGDASDVAVAGDYDGDGKTDIATFRPSGATWTILKSSSAGEAPETLTQQWGASGDGPQVGDFDGDNITDFVTWRLSDTGWRILSSFDGSNIGQQWGLDTDKPVPGDYDGDGKTDIAVVRPRVSETDNHSTWYILKSSDGSLMVAQWGADGDIAVPGKYNRFSQPACTGPNCLN